jgi:hypothetical protein
LAKLVPIHPPQKKRFLGVFDALSVVLVIFEKIPVALRHSCETCNTQSHTKASPASLALDMRVI